MIKRKIQKTHHKDRKKKKDKNASKEDSNEETQEKPKGGFAKFINMLTEEYEPEPTEEELAAQAEAKKAAMNEKQLKKEEAKKEKEEAKKAKAEEKEAAKKAKAEQAEAKKKEKQAAKEAKLAEKKAKEEAEGANKKGKKIGKKRIAIVAVFAASVLTAVLLSTNFINQSGALQRARKAYYAGDYKRVYLETYGEKLDDSDSLIQVRSKLILKMQLKYNSYINNRKMGRDIEALNALLQGIQTYDAINAEAEQYGVSEEVKDIKNNMLNMLSASYGLDENQARELINKNDSVSYTIALTNIISGNNDSLVMTNNN